MLKDSVDIKKRRSKTEPKENLASEAKKKKKREREIRELVWEQIEMRFQKSREEFQKVWDFL